MNTLSLASSSGLVRCSGAPTRTLSEGVETFDSPTLRFFGSGDFTAGDEDLALLALFLLAERPTRDPGTPGIFLVMLLLKFRWDDMFITELKRPRKAKRL